MKMRDKELRKCEAHSNSNSNLKSNFEGRGLRGEPTLRQSVAIATPEFFEFFFLVSKRRRFD